MNVHAVVGVHENRPNEQLVNLRVWDFDGDDQRRLNVPVVAPQPSSASFHLSADCPWGR